MKKQTMFNQMVKVNQVLQMLMDQGRRSCQLLYSSMETCSPFYKMFTSCTGGAHRTAEDRPTQVGLLSSPALIINISNSTLTSCVFGNANTVVENQPLIKASDFQMDELIRCNCSCGRHDPAQTTILPTLAEPRTIHIYRAHLNYVIIGDNNCMQVDQTNEITQETETETRD